MGWRFDMLTPAEPGQYREQSTVPGYEPVEPLAESREVSGVIVPVLQPLFPRIVGQRPERRFGATENRAVRFEQMNCGFEPLPAQLGKAESHTRVLKRKIINA